MTTNQPNQISRSEGFPTIILIADGWTRGVFLRLLESGQLPEISRDLVEPGVLIDPVVSIFPTVSIASHATLLTASKPSEHRIPGHRWVDETGLIRNYVGLRNYLSNGTASIDRDLSPRVNTVFEHHSSRPTYAVPSLVRRGATSATRVGRLDSVGLINRVATLASSQPDAVVVCWLARGDVLAHTHGPDSPQVHAEMRSVSQALGGLVRSLERTGVLDNSRILLVPDHGHRSVSNHGSLERAFSEAGMSVAINPRLRRAQRRRLVALTNGDSSAYVYGFQPGGKNEALRSLAKVVANPAVGLAFWRKDDSTSYVLDSSGAVELQFTEGDVVTARMLDGRDPLGLVEGDETTVSMNDPNRLRWRYPDVLYQYRASHVEGRSASLLLTAAADYHFSHGPRLGWRFGYHRGSHGGPLPDEILVAAAYRGPGSALAPSGVRSEDLLSSLGLIKPTFENEFNAQPKRGASSA